MNTKKGILAGMALLVVLIGAYLAFKNNSRPHPAPEASSPQPAPPAAVSSDIPPMLLIQPDGTQLSASSLQGKAVFVFFLPDCDHCQREAVQIRENIESFKDYTLYFISSAPFDQLSAFEQKYQLSNLSQVRFLRTTDRDILRNYGPIPTPTVYIYSEKGRLIKDFKGETPVESIMQYL